MASSLARRRPPVRGQPPVPLGAMGSATSLGLVAALRIGGLTANYVIDGAMNGT